jgi:hypothetical protein
MQPTRYQIIMQSQNCHIIYLIGPRENQNGHVCHPPSKSMIYLLPYSTSKLYLPVFLTLPYPQGSIRYHYYK